MDFLKKFRECKTPPGSVSLAWLGQAGFLLKNSAGKVLALDVYLSDLVERLDGNKRIMPALFTAEEMTPDLILVSHEHADHLDLDTLPAWLSKGIPMLTNGSSLKMCEQEGIKTESIRAMAVGDVREAEGFKVEAVFSRHGDWSPEALGFLIETDGVTVYFTGDTSFETRRLSALAERDIQVMIPPINGEYGNMNERDAAMLASLVKPKVTVPCHFWLFARHGGSPYQFETAMKTYAPDSGPYIMALGEIIRVDSEGIIR